MSAEAPLRVAIPWSLSRYIPMNGFHPLGEPWFVDNRQIAWQGVSLPGLARALEHSRWFGAECERRARRLAADWIQSQPDLELLAEFINHVTPEELWCASDLPGDIEYHHTSPMTAGRRPFVFFCEAFLPIFFPFFKHGGGVPRDYEEVRRLFASIFGSPACIGIVSHIPATLAEISRFFRNPAIDAKLMNTRVGFHEKNFRDLLAAPRRPIGAEGPRFLFTNSAHQNPHSVMLRGGIAVLRFAERWLRAGHPGSFVFRSGRPDDDTLKGWGVDPEYLRSQEPARVTWVETYLLAEQQMALFTSADVMLLPSAGLHSATIMQALAAGAIPVVSDTTGTDHYVEDGVTGIVLRGVKSHIWEEHQPSKILFDRYDRFPELGGALAEKLYDRLTPLLANPHEVAAMRERMRAQARERYSGDAYRDSISEALIRSWRERAGGRRDSHQSLLGAFGAVQDSGWEQVFALPPVPRRAPDMIPTEHCFAGASAFFRLRRKRLPGQDAWSPFELRRHGLLGRKGTRIFATLSEMREDTALSEPAQMLRSVRARLDYARRRWAL
jgi:hypothetical protein